MYAVVKTGGKQYKVSEGDIISVEKLPVSEGEKVVLDKVLLYSDGNELKVGNPYIDGMKVEADVIGGGKGPKIVVFKFKAKKNYRKKQGHRQPYTMLKISSIAINS
ncbi:MAG TPA: 50S ribosomal protein L21 [Anaerovoracaceae bacterium]|nr:50S ribosomal protein L21 [Anaerovoracaceae bacterium]